MSKKNIVLVTGASGFVGSHLVEKLLLDESNEVHVFDLPALDECRNLATVKEHPRLVYTQGDIQDSAALENWFRADADIIYHLASVVGIKHYIEDPLKLFDIVIGGTRLLVELARKNETKFILTSTSEVYGKNPKIGWKEEDDRVLGSPTIDRWSYSSAKAICEHMLNAVHRHTGLPMSIVRFFNVYGPRQNPIFVVSQSVYKVLRGESPYLYDDGEATRCFTYVDDAVDGLIAAATHPNGNGETFNIGRSVENSTKEAVDLIIEHGNPDITCENFYTEKEYGDTYEDIPRRVPNVEKAKDVLGWVANTELSEGIIKTIEWAKDNPWYCADRT